jgi:hypothetical protein
MELINLKQSFLYNNKQDKTIQETIIQKEANDYVVIDISSWAMK